MNGTSEHDVGCSIGNTVTDLSLVLPCATPCLFSLYRLNVGSAGRKTSMPFVGAFVTLDIYFLHNVSAHRKNQ